MLTVKNLARIVQIRLLMKIAIPYWHGRISPVFDVAGNVSLVEITDGCEKNRRDISLEAETLGSRIDTLVNAGAEVLVCGAISKPLEMGLTARGVKVIPQTCGDVELVLAAYIKCGLNPNAFLMPGCCGRGNRFRNRGQQSGSRGNCVCPGCGHASSHVPSQPCNQQTCPTCGTKMIRS